MANFDKQAALNAGYSPQEIDEYLRKNQPQPSILSKIANVATDVFVPQTKKFISDYPEYAKNVIQNPPTSFSDFTSRLGEGLKMGIKPGLEVASYGVPFGKGVVGALKGGAGVGLLRGMSEDQATPQSITASTIGGAATGGILGALSKGAKGVGQRIMKGVFKEPMKATKSAIKKGTSLGEEAFKRGERGTTESIYTKALQKTQELENNLQNLLFGSNEKVSTGNVRKMLNPLIKDLEQAGNKTDAQSILNRIVEIERVSGKNIPAARAQEIKRALYDEVRRSYGVQGSA